MLIELLLFISLLPLLLSLVYSPLLRLLSEGKNLNYRELKELPEISVVVPTYNEEENVKMKIESLIDLDYPEDKREIILVDGGSDDRTLELADEYNIKTIDLNERGKTKAINKGLDEASHDKVVLTDCDILLDENALKESLKYLTEEVGAVTLPADSASKAEGTWKKGRRLYYRDEWDTRYKESLIEGACSLDGKFILLRGEVIDKVKRGYTDDFKLTLQLREKGYKSVVPQEPRIEEFREEGLLDEMRKMRRTCRLAIGTSLTNLKDVYSKRDKYSRIIFPLHRFFNFFVPISFIFLLPYLIYTAPVVLALLFFMDIVISFTKKKFLYYHLLLLSLTLAWIDLITGNIKKGCKWNY